MVQGTRAMRDNNDEVEVEVRVMRMRSLYQHITLNNQIKGQGTRDDDDNDDNDDDDKDNEYNEAASNTSMIVNWGRTLHRSNDGTSN